MERLIESKKTNIHSEIERWIENYPSRWRCEQSAECLRSRSVFGPNWIGWVRLGWVRLG